MLWSHNRNIDVSVFSNKVVYRIPLYSDFMFKNAKIEYCNEGRELKLTTYQEPAEPHSGASSCDSQINLKVRPDEIDKYFPSHQPPSHKTKCDSYASSTTSSILSG
jgi:hypothetical protein